MTVDTRAPVIDFRTAPERYRHWRLKVDGRVAILAMDVEEAGGLSPEDTLKLNSYDLGVDITAVRRKTSFFLNAQRRAGTCRRGR